MKAQLLDTSRPSNQILKGDCRDVLSNVAENYFSACITDPPYNYEFIGREWDAAEISRRLERVQNSRTLVKNIPYGSGLAGGVRNERWYAKVRENILEYERWCAEWGKQVFRTLRPGAFALVFNSTRTVAHVQTALEKAGFYSRDIIVYRRHSGIPKGLNGARKISRSDAIGSEDWSGWHSCLRNEWEAICVVQKPLIGNYAKTIEKYGVGLLKAQQGAGFQSNIIEGVRLRPEDSVEIHCTVKPLDLMERLVRLVAPPGPKHIILDPFAGSGTTCLAANLLGNSYLGIEINTEYCEVSRARLSVKLPHQKASDDQLETLTQALPAKLQDQLLFSL